MLDFFVILSKGGIVLWYMQATASALKAPINALLQSILLNNTRFATNFTHDSHIIKFHMDNEFELLYIVGYQKVLQLSYVDKLLTSVELEFRDRYKKALLDRAYGQSFDAFGDRFQSILLVIEKEARDTKQNAKPMRDFKDTEKASKTVASMIINNSTKANDQQAASAGNNTSKKKISNLLVKEQNNASEPTNLTNGNHRSSKDEDDSSKTAEVLQKLSSKFGTKQTKSVSKEDKKAATKEPKKGKEGRRWDNSATAEEAAALDYSATSQSINGTNDLGMSKEDAKALAQLRGQMTGDLNEVEVSSEEEDVQEESPKRSKVANNKPGMFSKFFSNLGINSSSVPLTEEQIRPSLDHLRDHLINKNVACEIAQKLCDSVAQSLIGLQLGTFERPQTRVKAAVSDACVRLLSSCRRLDVLRDILDAKEQARAYTIVFCGVNGVGKSTNLAKIAFWLTEKNLRVLIAACDTFRSGAVEQLRTHVQRLNYVHPSDRPDQLPMVELYEKGYGKDAAAIATSAINYAKDHMCDVVLVDTAGRMQDNEPLMRALSKLINVNKPDLCLFVGEALVGNESVDQLKKFNQALADHSQMANPRGIDGIVLTKFDTIDDKVGAAISMAYISGQPIVFVGTGQTYADLKQLSVNSVVKALMK